MIKGAIFDMDGTLFDTEYVNDIVLEELLTSLGYTVPKTLFNSVRCMSSEETEKILKQTFGQDFDYKSFYELEHIKMREYLEENGIPKKEGIHEILDYLKSKDYPMAIASASRVETIKYNLKKAGIEDYFSVLVGGDIVNNMKPHPEIFIKAAQELGLNPTETIAFEDSPNGVRSASAAGCITIMIPDIIPADEELKALSRVVLPTLKDAIPYLESYKG